jgi:hypothetical protein
MIMKWKIFLAVLATCFAFTLTATRAEAQATRTWVSGVGDDANPCSRTAPCKTFAGTIPKTAPGGEINCLDNGSFGAVTITKSITIDCTATMAGMTASTTTGILINAAGATVNIRGVSITGAPAALPGNFGIRILTAANVTIERVRIQNFIAVSPNGFGIGVLPASGTVSINIIDSVITGSGTATSGAAINIAPTGSGAVVANINNVDIGNNYRGIVYAGNATTAGSGSLTVANTRVFRSADTAITVTSGANGVPTFLDNLVINNNGTGIVLTGGGVVARLGRSVIAFNGTAVSSSGGAGLQSYKDNRIDFNSNNSTPLPMATPE